MSPFQVTPGTFCVCHEVWNTADLEACLTANGVHTDTSILQETPSISTELQYKNPVVQTETVDLPWEVSSGMDVDTSIIPIERKAQYLCNFPVIVHFQYLLETCIPRALYHMACLQFPEVEQTSSGPSMHTIPNLIVDVVTNHPELMTLQSLYHDACNRDNITFWNCLTGRVNAIILNAFVSWWQSTHADSGTIKAIESNCILLDMHLNDGQSGTQLFERFTSFYFKQNLRAATINLSLKTLFETNVVSQINMGFQGINIDISCDFPVMNSQVAEDNSFLERWPHMQDMYLNAEFHLGQIENNTVIDPDSANFYELAFYNIFQGIDRFCKDDGSLTDNANMAIHVCSRFLRFKKDESLGQNDDDEENSKPKKFSGMEKGFILMGLFKIYNHYGLLSESGLDPLSAGKGKQLYIPIEVSCHSGRKVYNYVFRSGPEYQQVILTFLSKLAPVHSILQAEFDMQSFDTTLYNVERFERYMFGNELPTHPFPRVPKFASGYAFNDGFLYFGKHVLDSDEDQSTILRFYSWDNPKEFPKELATRKVVFDDKQFYNTNIEPVMLKLQSGRQLPTPQNGDVHWLCTFVLDHLERNDYDTVKAIYFLAIVLFTQTRQFHGEQDYLIHDIHDIQGWKSIQRDEWECLEYAMGCMGWVLGIVCKFPVILWLQGKPGTGKSSILSEFLAHVVRKTEHANPSDTSKHMLPILNRDSDGTIQCADAIFFSDLQTTIPKDVVGKLCSITDPGPKGSYTSDPKGKDPMELQKRKKGNGNVSALVASNISAPNAIGKQESETGIYRRMFKMSFNYSIPKNSHVDPATVIKDYSVMGHLIAMSCCVGYNHSIQYNNNTAMFIPSLMAKMNSEYEECAHEDLSDLAYDFCRHAIVHTTEEVGLVKSKIKQRFLNYCQTKERIITEKQQRDFEHILDAQILRQYGQKKYQKLMMCETCLRLHQWKGPNHTESMSNISSAKEYAHENNIKCGGSSMHCDIRRKHNVFINLKFLYVPDDQ